MVEGDVVQLWPVHWVQNVYSFTNSALQSTAHVCEHRILQVYKVLLRTRSIMDNLLWFCLRVLTSSSTVAWPHSLYRQSTYSSCKLKCSNTRTINWNCWVVCRVWNYAEHCKFIDLPASPWLSCVSQDDLEVAAVLVVVVAMVLVGDTVVMMA